jgi:hypothetical protein
MTGQISCMKRSLMAGSYARCMIVFPVENMIVSLPAIIMPINSSIVFSMFPVYRSLVKRMESRSPPSSNALYELPLFRFSMIFVIPYLSD